MKKRGQITLFVIIGLILLIVVGLALYFMSKAEVEEIPIGEEQFKVSYDLNLEPVHSDISYCAKELAKEALKKMGVQGGYLDTSNIRHNSPSVYQNTGLELFEDSGLIIPYWYHIASVPTCTDCNQAINIPPLNGRNENSLQAQTQKYIDDNLLDCVDSFSAYSQDFEIKYGLPKSSVFFREDDTFIGVDWPLNVTFNDGSKSSRLQYFSSELDLDMKSIYFLAFSTLYQLEMQNDNRVLEQFTTDTLTYYSLGGTQAMIPPLQGPTEFGLAVPKIWIIEDIKDIVKEAISEHIPFIQILGSKGSYYYFSDNQAEEDLYAQYQYKVYSEDKALAHTQIRFDYFPIWPIYLDISPNSGGVIFPEAVSLDLLFLNLGYSKYQFEYDVIYPVLVSFENKDALEGEGYTFQYAYEVNVRNNKPYTNESINFSSILNQDELPSDEDDLFGSPEQKTVSVKINVINGYTMLPVEGVSVVLDCFDKSVYVGKSEMNQGRALIDAKVQPCLSGLFTHINPEFAGESVPMSLNADNVYEFNYEVYPKKKMDLRFRKRMFVPTKPPVSEESIDRDWKMTGGEAYNNIEKDEEVLLILTRIENGIETNDVQVLIANYSTPGGFVDLVPGQYSLSVISNLLVGENYTKAYVEVPGRTFEAGFDPLGAGDLLGTTEKVTIPSIFFNDSLLIGMLTLDNSTMGLFNVTRNDILTKNRINVYYASYPNEQLLYAEDLQVLSRIGEAAKTYPDLLYPEFE